MNGTPRAISTRDGETLPLEQFEITVPESRTDSASPLLRLRALRWSSPTPQGPPVFFLSGGPGESAIQWLQHAPFRKTFAQIAKRNDLWLIEQRGCGESERDLFVRVPSPRRGDLADEEAYRRFLTDPFGTRAKELSEQGARLDGYQALESAEDLLQWAALAAGDDPIQLLAVSYGTHLAQHLIRQAPQRIQRAVLCGFEGPDQTFKLPTRIQTAVERLGLNETLVRAISTGPWTLADGSKLSPFVLQHLAASWLGLSNRIDDLRRLVNELAQGRAEAWSEAMPKFSKSWNRPLTYYLKDAHSGVSPERWAQIGAEADAAVLGNAANFPFPEVGELLGVQPLGNHHRAPLVTDVPLRVCTGELDGFTPSQNFEESRGGFANFEWREIPGAFHNDLIHWPGAGDWFSEWFAQS